MKASGRFWTDLKAAILHIILYVSSSFKVQVAGDHFKTLKIYLKYTLWRGPSMLKVEANPGHHKYSTLWSWFFFPVLMVIWWGVHCNAAFWYYMIRFRLDWQSDNKLSYITTVPGWSMDLLACGSQG